MSDHRHTRRDALKFFGAGTAAAWAWPGAAQQTVPGGKPRGPGYFPLNDVRLDPGPFATAASLDAIYLLQLEPDRMLHNFRVNAGLEPKAPVYGGWESQEPWVEIRCHGHTLGHYLTACACMRQTTGDLVFSGRVDYIVAELAACQQKTGGWLTAFPDGVAPLTDSLAGKPFAGVPWYTTHKVLAGLRDAHTIGGSTAALEVLVKFADWIDATCADVPEGRFQKMLDREHGGMNEVFADLWQLTREPRYRSLAQRFSHQALLKPLSEGRDTLDGLHANTQIPKVVGFSRMEELWGPGDFGKAAQFFWKTVTGTRSYATGGHGDVEHFFPVGKFAEHLGSAKTMETCCTHNMLRLTRSLYAQDPRATYFDYFERALFNGILASQDPDSGMQTYFQATRPGYVKLFHTPFDSFWCCTGTGIENHARYGENIYAYDGATLYVNLFIASSLDWKDLDTRVDQATNFPDQASTRLTFHPSKRRELTVALRQPSWCPVMTLTINGRERRIARRPGEYFRLTRKFRPGDVIDVSVPMKLHLEALPHSSEPSSMEWAAVMYGPIVMAGIVGKPVEPAAQLIVNERKSGEMLNEPVTVPAWPRPLAELPAHFTRTDPNRLTFIAAGFAGGPVQFIPWFRIAHERYNLYWRANT